MIRSIIVAAAGLLLTGCFLFSDVSPELLPTLEGLTVEAFQSETVEISPDGTFELAVEGTEIAVTALLIQTVGAHGKLKVEVAQLSGTPDRIAPPSAGDVYQYIQIENDTLETDNIATATIGFEVPKDWIEASGYDDEDIALERHVAGGWEVLPTEVVDRDSLRVAYVASSQGLSLFAITAAALQERIVQLTTPVPLSTATAIAPRPTTSQRLSPEPTSPASLTASPAPTPGLTRIPFPTPASVPSPTATKTSVPESPVSGQPTPAATPTAMASAVPTSVLTATPNPTIAPQPLLTATPSPTATRRPTRIPTRRPSLTPTPTTQPPPTTVPSPTPTSSPSPTPSPTPVPTPDPRYGVVVSSSDNDAGHFLDELDVDWYLNFTANTAGIPSGRNKVMFINSIQPGKLMSAGSIAALVGSAQAGSYWYIGGEPNRTTVTGAQFADVFHHYYTNITAADPTAKITGPSVLNWDFTCIGCGGYVSGESWLIDFITTYEATYSAKPPVDVWAMDVYPIDWLNTPNNDTVRLASYQGQNVLHSFIATQQLVNMRQYLDANGYASTPIWITEIAIHVGYESWSYNPIPNIDPVLPYHWDNMSNYMNEVLDWLEVNASSKKIEKWFFYSTWIDIVDVGADGYMGIIFFDGPQKGSSLNCLGEVYRARSLGAPPLACDFGGNTVPAN